LTFYIELKHKLFKERKDKHMPNKPFPTKKQFSSHNLLTKGKILFRKKLRYVCNYKIFTENIQAIVPTRISPSLK